MMGNRVLGMVCGAILLLLGTLSLVFHPDPVQERRPLEQPGRPSGTPVQSPRLQAVDALVSGKQGARTCWTARAASVRLDDARNRLDAAEVECTFYDDAQEPRATVTSASATLDTRTRDVWFHGPTHVRSSKGETLDVVALRYDGSTRLLLGHGGVCITRGTSVLTGDRITASPDLRVVTVGGHVRAHVRSVATRP